MHESGHGRLQEAVYVFCGSLTIVGTLSIILSYVLFVPLRSRWRQLLVLLSFFDLCQGLFYIGNYFHYSSGESDLSTFCKAQRYFNIFTCTTSFFCTACISIYVCDMLNLEISPQREQRVVVLTYALPLGYSLLVCIILFFFDRQHGYQVVGGDPDSFGCYITHNFVSMRVLCTYAPLIASWAVTVIFYVKSLLRLKALVKSSTNDSQNVRNDLISVQRRLMLVPLAFVLLRLPDFLYRVIEYPAGPRFQHSPAGQLLNLACAIANPSQGFINSVIFVAFSWRVRRSFMLTLTNCRITVASNQKEAGSKERLLPSHVPSSAC